MSTPPALQILPAEAAAPADHPGRVCVLAEPGVRFDPAGTRLDRLMRGALARAAESPAFARLRPGEGLELQFPAGLAAQTVHLVRLARGADARAARTAGGTIGKAMGPDGALVLAGAHRHAGEIALGALLGAYAFGRHKSDPGPAPGALRLAVTRPETLDAQALAARAAAVWMTRDLVNEPANVLTTEAFAARLQGLREHGLSVEVLDEDALERLGMRALLAVGQGSESRSRVVVMEWRGGAPGEAPLVVAGKGVVFDAGGISLKPAQGMEEMTMDMGGAAVVAGLMRALADRRARANVVGIVGLVENMPDGRAQRPGDVVRSLKGDTVEVINTDAEGRLVLADVLWYAQDRFGPAAIVDLATLTGAIVVALGHHRAGLFANDDGLAAALLAAAAAEGEDAWRMPLDPAYDAQIKSRIADMKNTGGRPGGAVTAAQFLQRFIRPGTPWAHLDIAGVTLRSEATAVAPKGATGWGVLALDRLVRERFEPR